MKSICLFDWDGTLRHGITAFDWMQYLRPILPNADRSARAMKDLLGEYRSGEVNYRHLVRKAAELYAECVDGAVVGDVSRIADQYVRDDIRNLFDFVPSLLEQIQTNGMETVIVSGAPGEVLDAYSRILPIGRVYGLVVGQVNGHFANVIRQNHGLTTKKREVVDSLRAEGYKIRLAAGNSANDLPLLEYAEKRFLISDEHEFKDGVDAFLVDTKHAFQMFKGAL